MKLTKHKKRLYSGVFIDHGLSHRRALDRYKKRRGFFINQLKYPVLIFSVDVGPGGHNIWPYIASPIYQEPLFIWLTGINQYPCALFLDSQTKDEILFLPPRDPSFEFWQGIRLGVGTEESVKSAAYVTGIASIEKLSDVGTCLKSRFKSKTVGAKLGLLWFEGKKNNKKIVFRDSNWIQNKNIKKELKKDNPQMTYINVCEEQFKIRLPLDAVDIRNARKANVLTGEAFKQTLPEVKSCRYEYELCGKLEGYMLEKTPYGKSFPTIAASGKNATILHYEKYDDQIVNGELFLLDFGIRWGTMHADISRTIPVSGRFNPLQKLLYNICLKAQIKVEQKAKVGMTIKDLDDYCWNYIESELKIRFLDKGGNMRRDYEFSPHGVSHLMGEMEHDGDPLGNYKHIPMKEGWMISNEPGIYGHFSININGTFYSEYIGIRLEDNLVIKNNGCFNLSKSIPKTTDEIEQIMNA